MTNGEKIRQSNESLVEFFLSDDYPYCDDNHCEIDETGTVLYCERCLLRWLNSEEKVADE